GEAEPADDAVVIYHIDADDLRLLAAVGGDIGYVERLPRAAEDAAVALVEPLRRHAALSRRRPTTGQAHIEHPSAVRLRPDALRLLVHLVALFDAAQVRQARSRHQKPRPRFFRDRRQHPARSEEVGVVERRW